MKLLCVIIRPFKLDTVKQALEGKEIQGMTVFEIKGYGRQRGHCDIYQSSGPAGDLIPKLMMMLVVPEKRVIEVQQVIRDSAITGKPGDGMMWELPLDSVLRIRTGEFVTDDNLMPPESHTGH